MPLNVRRFFAFVSFTLFGLTAASSAQTVPTATPLPATTSTAPAAPVTSAPVAAPSAAEVMRDRISKAKAFIAVRNYNAAIYELENIRRETRDQSVSGVLNVLLMNSYLEQGDYKRAQDFLKEMYNPQKAAKPVPSPYYFAVAAQIVKGSRNQLERYRSLGLTVSDRNLPLEASVDIEKMRETLELVVEQSKVIGADKSKTGDAMALLEEATTSRGMLARDDYDAKRWKDEVGDARETLTSSRSTVFNAVNDASPVADSTATQTAVAAANTAAPTVVKTDAKTAAPKIETATLFKPVAEKNTSESVQSDSSAEKSANAVTGETSSTNIPKPTGPAPDETKSARVRRVGGETVSEAKPEVKSEAAPADKPADSGPLAVGSLIEYATKQMKPTYPAAARTTRQTGVVKVEIVINENGEVAEVQKTSGPSMLQSAAKDAVKKWKFKPFTRDGQPVKASGYVSFNFAL